ncbi:hypothetical protein V501_06970 [Pseudogymnoascus sp. VKM F-4519 (FW-2642)]|nr:hypothetical protein V501_06970 [Pseudogymnoascus sp. VKM F-4519 (FW-2642)]
MAGNQLLENITEFSSKRVRASSDAPQDTADSLEFNPLAFAGGYNTNLYLKSPNASDPGFHVTTGALMAISAYIRSLFLANYTNALSAQDLPSSFPRVRQELDTNLGTAGAVGLNGAGQSLDLEHDERDERL